jgi:hypothetical protein
VRVGFRLRCLQVAFSVLQNPRQRCGHVADATEPRCVKSTTRANFAPEMLRLREGRLHVGRDGSGSPAQRPPRFQHWEFAVSLGGVRGEKRKALMYVGITLLRTLAILHRNGCCGPEMAVICCL